MSVLVAFARAVDRLTDPAALLRMTTCACGSQMFLAALVVGPSVVTGETGGYFPGLAGVSSPIYWPEWEYVEYVVLLHNVFAAALAALGGWIAGAITRDRAEAGFVLLGVGLPFAAAAASVSMVSPSSVAFFFGWWFPWAAALLVRVRNRGRP